ncbi:heparinase II/III family protein [Algoriphagus sp. H41]|uniref:Heparinase II/III family protein n=1 Tax=Algoriphagus oliviformis TaxID=2811231 RepID=A0ABS3BYK2_9BACT|nr:heparinase II/III family protein [Algoriphagus oliviformis]MBN7809763.1 heparinase II/III family protein [Algoriphagus oliviformis]
MRRFRDFLVFILFTVCTGALAQSETGLYPLSEEKDFFAQLPQSIPHVDRIKANYAQGNTAEARRELAAYFREKAKNRFYFNWENIPVRLKEYQQLYPNAAKNHLKDADSHTELYHAETDWKLPFTNKQGKEVTAYEIRHLFRQHKAGDFAFSYFLLDKKELLPYFTSQAKSLNQAYQNGAVELIADGNGAYESFRGGNRMENWVLTHHLFLASPEYSDEDQITLLRTFLHHAEVLYQTNQKFQFGNHQTKGMVALAVIAMMYPEFEATKTYYDFALANLGQHLDLEVNADGFQFERSFHYHVGDIDNYFRVFKLAQITGNPIPKAWEGKLRGMFEAMVTLALPNKMAPVIQDDTDQPMATMNQLDEVMALGYALFSDPEFGFFASSNPSEEYYWLLSQVDLGRLRAKTETKPTGKSTALEATGYYVFREGWKESDQYLLISTGVSKEKPDHQHGDVLGLQLFANGEMLVPNYQVRYPEPEFPFFKNSWAKNVALVDSIPQGQEWTGNQGGSGFGKFGKLPKAEVLLWEPKGKIQAFRGTHDGYQDLGVGYERSVYFFPGEFWLVRDRFSGDQNHVYYQNFQGNYSLESGPILARSSQADGSGMDLIQLGSQLAGADVAGINGKNRVTFRSEPTPSLDFVTLLRPYDSFQDRTSAVDAAAKILLGDWEVHRQSLELKGSKFLADQILRKGDLLLLLGMRGIQSENLSLQSSKPVDIQVVLGEKGMELKSFEPNPIPLESSTGTLTLSTQPTQINHEN